MTSNLERTGFTADGFAVAKMYEGRIAELEAEVERLRDCEEINLIERGFADRLEKLEQLRREAVVLVETWGVEPKDLMGDSPAEAALRSALEAVT